MPLTIKPASGSGSVTLQSVAGTSTNDTLTLPAKTGNIITSADSGTVTQAMMASNVAGNGPAFLAYMNNGGSNQTVTSGTWTKIKIDTEETNGDTNNCFDTTNNRFLPTVAGYYQINGNAASAAGSTYIIAAIYKNGTSYKIGTYVTYAAGGAPYASVSSLVYMNGTTDYVELYAYTSGSTSLERGSTASYLNGSMVRAA